MANKQDEFVFKSRGIVDPDILQKDTEAFTKMWNKFDEITERIAVHPAKQVFNEVVTHTAEKLSEESQNDSGIRAAINTKEISHPEIPNLLGVQREKYAVFGIPNGQGKTRYDVINLQEEKKVVGGLCLVDSANAIVKLLNNNYSFYSPEVNTVLKLEEKYTKHYNDAVSFQRKYKNSKQDEVAKIRFDESKEKFLQIKEELINFNKQI